MNSSSSSTPSALDWPLPLAPPAAPPELDDLLGRLSVEQKIANGAEHLLSLFDRDNKQADNEVLKRQVESELANANESIRELQAAIEGLKRSYAEAYREKSASPIPTASDFASTSALGLDVESTSADTREWLEGSTYRNSSSYLGDSTFSPSTSALDIMGKAPSRQDGERTNDQAYRRQALTLLDLLHTIASQTSNTISAEPTIDAKSPFAAMGPPTTPSSTRTAQKVRAASRNRAAHAARSPNDSSASADGMDSSSSEDGQRKIEIMDSLVGVLRRSVRVRYELTAERVLMATLPCLTEWAGMETRAAAWRLLRHSLVPLDMDLAESWRVHNVDLYLIRTLLRDRKAVVEKEQALKLIRAVLELNHKSVNSGGGAARYEHRILGDGVVRALVAASEPVDEPMRNVYIETLAEMAIMDLPLLCRGGGLSAVIHSLADGPHEIAPEVAKVLLFLADGPTTRALFRPSVDLEYALSTLTDMPVQDAPHQQAEALTTSARVVSVMLRTWTGLIYLCMNQRRAIVSLVTAMKVSGKDVQETILRHIIEVFDVGLGIERQKQRAQAKLQSDLPELETAEGRSFPSRAAREMSREQRERNRHRITLIDQYLSLLLVVFIESGIIDALVHILQSTTETSRSATLLMGTLLQFGNRVLPHNYNVMVNQLPDLFASASQFHKYESRGKAATALSAVEKASSVVRTQASATRSIGRPRGDSSVAGGGAGGSTSEDTPLRRPVDKAKILQGINVDDNTFRNQIIETQVLSTRDQTKWNVDIMMDLLQGPLLSPRRLEEAMRGTKLLKRLLAFFHPFALRFSDLPATPPNRVYIRLATTLLNTLLTLSEGIKFLAEDRLLKEVRDAFSQIDPTSSAPSSDPIFAKSRITSTLSQGYLEMIGTLSASTEGSKLLGRFGIWSALYRLCQQQTRDDIVRVMIEKLDYSLDSHPRILLAWVLTSASRPLRKSATELLTRLIRRSPNPREWMISLLLAQLCDPVSSIRDIAVTMVKDVCSWPRALEMVVSLRPTLDHLGETGHELLLRFLSTPGGVRYLLEGDYIDREMDEWLNERSHRYAVQIEVNLTRALSIYRNKDDPDLEAEFDGTAPPHFYGELVKTPEGCQVLNQKGHFLEFAHFIRQHGMEGSDGEILAKLKSILWTVANIGATTGGFPFLEAHGTVACIVDIAERSPVLSVRGTCFYVIGLISTTRQGAESLHDHGWQSVCTTFGAPIGICLPVQLDDFVYLPAWQYEERSAVQPSTSTVLQPPASTLHRSILASISNLGNSILANKTAKTLSRLKTRHRSAFRDLSLFVRALEVLDGYKLRQAVRRFIWDLFEVNLDEGTVERIAAKRRQMMASTASTGRRGAMNGGTHSNGGAVPRSVTLPAMSSPAVGSQTRRMSSALPVRSMRRNDLRPNPIEDAAYADAVGEEDGEEADELGHHDGGEDASSGEEEESADASGSEDEEDEDETEQGEQGEQDDADERLRDGGLGLGLSLHGAGNGQAPKRRSLSSSAALGRHGASTTALGAMRGAATTLPFPAHESLVVIDGFGEHRSSRLVDPPRYAPAPGVRIIGGFGTAGAAGESDFPSGGAGGPAGGGVTAVSVADEM